MASLSKKKNVYNATACLLSRRKTVIFYFIWLCTGWFQESQSNCTTVLGAGMKRFEDGRDLREAFPFHACATCASGL